MLKKVAISLGHACLIVSLHLFYFNLNWSVPLEYEMMTAMNKLETFAGTTGKFNKSNCLFINTAYDLDLVQTETEYGDEGYVVITNRELLAQLFEKLASFGNKHKYVLCDILFDVATNKDSMLHEAFKKIKKIIIPDEYNEHNRKLENPIFHVKHAQADYITYEGMVSKIRLYASESKSKTLPLLMFEDYNNVKTSATSLGLVYKNSYIPSSMYPRYFFDRHSMNQFELRLKSVVDVLKDTLSYNNLIKDKMIVIGNFSSDTHFTPIGAMPGSLILFNTYLTLESSYHLLGFGWFIFAIICFSFLCYAEFIYKKENPSVTDKNWRTLTWHLLGITGVCVFISLISGLIFRVHITIIPVILYLEIFRHIGKIKSFQLNFKK